MEGNGNLSDLIERHNAMNDLIILPQSIFHQFDEKKSNKIEGFKLRDALAAAGFQLNSHILNSLIYRYGSSDNTIAFDEFVMCAVKVKSMIEQFKEKDVDNDNKAEFTIDEWMTKSIYS